MILASKRGYSKNGRGAAGRGLGGVDCGHRQGSAEAERGYRWSHQKKVGGTTLYPYRTRIGSHSLSLAIACTEYGVHIVSIACIQRCVSKVFAAKELTALAHRLLNTDISYLSSPALGTFKHLNAFIAPSLYLLPPLSLIIF